VLIVHGGEENQSSSNLCVTGNEAIVSLRLSPTETPPVAPPQRIDPLARDDVGREALRRQQ
jgi:hypothetical protein